jgi:hypothetical protein
MRDIDESVRMLEALDLDVAFKVEFALVLSGDKPADAWYESYAFYQTGTGPDVRGHDRFDELRAWAEASGLVIEATDEHIDDQGNRFDRATGDPRGEIFSARYREPGKQLKTAEDRLTMLIARNKVWLRKMKAAYDSNDDDLLGECYGFPPTARAAFLTGAIISPDEVQAPIEILAFATFMLSREHWRTDLKTAAQWSKTIKKLSPVLFAGKVERQLRRQA